MSRGKRGEGAKRRRAINRVAQQRQSAWLGRDEAGRVDISPVPVRIRVAELTDELGQLYASKRSQVKLSEP